MNCPSCGEAAPDDAKWCEACGHDLNVEPLPKCVSCGEREVAEEGYCLSCGHKQPEERDHMEFEDGPVVAVTDRGKRHRHNEDAVAIGAAADGTAVLVVCDGVSSTAGSAEASLRAATAARDLLMAGLSDGGPIWSLPAPDPAHRAEAAAADAGDSASPGPAGAAPDGLAAGAESSETAESAADDESSDVGGPAADGPIGDGSTSDDDAAAAGGSGDAQAPALAPAPSVVALDDLLTTAVAAAQAEASHSTAMEVSGPHNDGGPPSSTFVAVVARPDNDGLTLATAWVGDSRAYWLGADARRLTGPDHELDGSLVRWLGADSIDPTPEIKIDAVTGPGTVVVCSDGLWRYAAETSELNELVQRLHSEGKTGIDLASAMVAFANDGGGHDNISVALWAHQPA